MHWFCLYDLSHVSGIVQKYAIVKPSVPIAWLIQEGTNLTQKEVTTLKKQCFLLL
jgi:hypothetical protein